MYLKKIFSGLLVAAMLLVSACAAKASSAAIPEEYLPAVAPEASLTEVEEFYSDKNKSERFEVFISSIQNRTPPDSYYFGENYSSGVVFSDTTYLGYEGETLCIFDKEDNLSIIGFTFPHEDFSTDPFEEYYASFCKIFGEKTVLYIAYGSNVSISRQAACWLFTPADGQRTQCFCLMVDHEIRSIRIMQFYPDIIPGGRTESVVVENIINTFRNADLMRGEPR